MGSHCACVIEEWLQFLSKTIPMTDHKACNVKLSIAYCSTVCPSLDGFMAVLPFLCENCKVGETCNFD